jgi:hypothetical protein
MYHGAEGRRVILPLVRRRAWPPRIAVMASPPPGWGFGGLIADEGVRAGDVDLVLDDLARRPGIRVSIRPNPLQASRWAARAGAETVARCAHVLDLRAGPDAIWAGLRSAARNEIRKAGARVEIETDTNGRLLPVFFDLLDISRSRWAQQQHEPAWLAQWRGNRQDSLDKWQRIAGVLGAACRVSVAWADGRPAAGLVVLQGTNAHYTRGAMDRDVAAPTHANAALQWKAIRDAAAAGCAWYHMGESGTSSSLARFKERFGARPYDYAEYRFERLPLTTLDHFARDAVKRAIGFREAS